MPDTSQASRLSGISERLGEFAGNSAFLVVVAILGLTSWIVLIAGLVMLFSLYVGIAAALLIVALLVAVGALTIILVLRSRLRRQRLRAQARQSTGHKTLEAAVLATLPDLVEDRPGTLLVASGLAIGAMIVASLKRGKET